MGLVLTQKPDGVELEQRPDGTVISHITVNGLTLSRPFAAAPEGEHHANSRDVRRNGGYIGARFGSLGSRSSIAKDEDGIEFDAGHAYGDPFVGMVTSQEEFDALRAKRHASDNNRRVRSRLEPDAQPNDIGRLGDP